jgi:hypothetical protein
MFSGANQLLLGLEKAIAEKDPSKIQRILRNRDAEQGCHVLDPLPEPLYQDGPVCGYTAISSITKYWHTMVRRYPFHRVRIRNSHDPEAPTPLRILAKNAGLKGIGGIFDADEFVTIMNGTEYKANVLSYNSKEELLEKIKLAIKLEIPFILPVDMSGTLVKEEGRRAHYVTVGGYIEESPNKIFLICIADLSYYLFSLDDVFESAANLKQTMDRRFYKRPGCSDMWRDLKDQPLPDGALLHEHKSTDLQNIRMKMVLIYPKDMQHRIDPAFNSPAPAPAQPSQALPSRMGVFRQPPVPSEQNVFTSQAFKQSIANYIAYKDKFFFRWFMSSRISYQTALQMKSAKTDKERFDIAKTFVEKHGDKQLAKNLLEVVPKLKFK